MHISRLFLCGVAISLTGMPLADAADQPGDPVQVERKKGEARPLRIRGGGEELVPEKILEKLSLTKEQKEQFEKINQDFQDKQKDVQAKLEDAKKNRDRSKYMEAIQAQQKLRPDYLTRLENVLTDAQKKTLDEVRRANPRARANAGAAPSRTGIALPAQLLPPQLQERLQLTEEQKNKLAELQKDVDSKIQKLLTEEQRKLLEDMKKPAQPRKRQESTLNDGEVEDKRPLRSDGALKVGDPAPDFTVRDVDGKHTVTLSKLKGKPVVLIFGSCT